MSLVNEDKTKKNLKASFAQAVIDLEEIKIKDHDNKTKTNDSMKKISEIIQNIINFLD